MARHPRKKKGTSDNLEISYSVTSNGSALLEESNTGGVEMLSIFNFQNNELVLTHYCGLQNKPVSVLQSSSNQEYVLTTDSERIGLSKDKEPFVTSCKISLIPEDTNKIYYQYTTTGSKGEVFVAKAVLTKAQPFQFLNFLLSRFETSYFITLL